MQSYCSIIDLLFEVFHLNQNLLNPHKYQYHHLPFHQNEKNTKINYFIKLTEIY